MMRSRTTFATIDAAAIESMRASPSTTACCAHAMPGIAIDAVDEHQLGRDAAAAATARAHRLEARAADVHVVDRARADHRPRKRPGLV